VPDKELPRAIRKIQKVLKEPVTGIFSDKMMDIMTKPRCGTEEPYNETAANEPAGLHKRYVIWGSKWAKTSLTWRFVNYSSDLPAAQQQSTLRYVNLLLISLQYLLGKNHAITHPSALHLEIKEPGSR
jgi:hypothetical protein